MNAINNYEKTLTVCISVLSIEYQDRHALIFNVQTTFVGRQRIMLRKEISTAEKEKGCLEGIGATISVGTGGEDEAEGNIDNVAGKE